MTKMNEMSVNASVLSMSELENVNGGVCIRMGSRRKIRK